MSGRTDVSGYDATGMQEGEPGARRETIRVLLADDHPSFTRGFKLLLDTEEGVEVVATAASAEEAFRAIEEHLPDIVLMDIRMPEIGGIEATKKIRATWPSVKVVMFTASRELSDVRESMRAGASGYLCKDAEPEHVIASLRAVDAGELVVSSLFGSSLFEEAGAGMSALTDAELHLLRLLARGLDHTSLAKEIAVSESTLKRQLNEIQRKLQADNRMQAVVKAAKRGLI